MFDLRGQRTTYTEELQIQELNSAALPGFQHQLTVRVARVPGMCWFVRLEQDKEKSYNLQYGI